MPRFFLLLLLGIAAACFIAGVDASNSHIDAPPQASIVKSQQQEKQQLLRRGRAVIKGARFSQGESLATVSKSEQEYIKAEEQVAKATSALNKLLSTRAKKINKRATKKKAIAASSASSSTARLDKIARTEAAIAHAARLERNARRMAAREAKLAKKDASKLAAAAATGKKIGGKKQKSTASSSSAGGKKIGGKQSASTAAAGGKKAIASTSSTQQIGSAVTSIVPNQKTSNQISSSSSPSSSSPFQRYRNDRSEENGLWKAGGVDPPYVPKVLMYAGPGTNFGAADVVRRWFGFKRAFRTQEWNTNQFLQSFNSEQFRYVARSKNGRLIFPPLSGPPPPFDSVSASLFKHFVQDGGNSLILCGGPNTIYFLNSLLPLFGYNGELVAKWEEGPFEKQTAALSSRFFLSPIMLPGEDVWGVDINSLPREAASYYEAPGVSVVFALKAGEGQIIYVGSTLASSLPQWKEVLMIAAKRGE